MKRFTALISTICLLLAVLTVWGCSKGTSVSWSGLCIGAVQRQNADMCSLSCESFDGTAIYTIHVNEGDHRLFITGNVVLKEGLLTVTISDEDGHLFYYEQLTEDTNIGVNLPDYGVYLIQVEGQKFQGSYEFSWAY